MQFEPSYIKLYKTGELEKRIKNIAEIYKLCTLCPQACEVDRYEGHGGKCKSSIMPTVSSASPHYGEEPPLVGYYGSGTIFFTNCNLHCIYCQNFDISQMSEGSEISYEQLAELIIALRNKGCHNINFVTPTHMLYQILRALEIAIEKGLNIPLVYNCGGYESVDTLKLLDGVFDIYMPDFKYYNEESGAALSDAKSYPQTAQMAISEMYRQVGDLKLNNSGIAYRGLLIRHLVLPEHTDESKKILEFIATLSRNTYVNIMDQYRPAYRAYENSSLTRRITSEEYQEVLDYAKKIGLERADNH
ncbi:MAG: radical SAM protein [Bacteroidales bacterium]|nr:MAG: radical SAM protein [Bacteroidales bacterium]